VKVIAQHPASHPVQLWEPNHMSAEDARDFTPSKSKMAAVSKSSSGVGDKGEENEVMRSEGDGERIYGSGGSWQAGEFGPLDLNYDALRHVATNYLPGNHGKCTKIHKLGRGSFHEIRVLEFEDGWTCISRFTRRRDEHLSVTESEVATMRYVRQHTRIPTPEVYFVNFDPTNSVGAPFVLMERMRGVHLYTIWDKLNTEHKSAVIEQIADVLVQLSRLKFDKIGSINLNGEVGPLQNQAIPHEEVERGPFANMEDFLLSFVSGNSPSAPEVKACYPDIRARLHENLEDQTDDPLYNPPSRLIHGDFDAQNMLFTWLDKTQPPKLSAIIDWDYSYTRPLYYLYDYPMFIQDAESMYDTPLWPENKILRKNLVSALLHSFPRDSEEPVRCAGVFSAEELFVQCF
jgi:hypothetical protein